MNVALDVSMVLTGSGRLWGYPLGYFSVFRLSISGFSLDFSCSGIGRLSTGLVLVDKTVDQGLGKEDFMQHLRAIAAHANYMKRVRGCLAEEVACTCYKPHTDCDFGKWWYTEVFPKKETFSPDAQALIETIDAAHRDFHAVSAKISEFSGRGQNEEAHRYETELLQHSNRLIQAILQLDQAGLGPKERSK